MSDQIPVYQPTPDKPGRTTWGEPARGRAPTAIVGFGGGSATVLYDDASLELVLAPALRDCVFDEIVEYLDGLPENVGLLFDREIGDFAVLRLDDRGLPDLGEYLKARPRAARRVADHFAGEVAQAGNDESKAEDLILKPRNLFLFTRHRILPLDAPAAPLAGDNT